MEKIIVRGERRANVNEIIELTDAMEQNPSWKFNSRLGTQEISLLL
jgi:hypothetical protein